MPTRWTFDLFSVDRFIAPYHRNGMVIVDPFCGNSFLGTIRNDLNKKSMSAQSNEDAIEFLAKLPDMSADLVLLDPPYSSRQIAECYAGVGGSWDGRHPAFIARIRDHAARICRRNGYAISFGWNSTGLGKKRGFRLVDLLIVNHGGSHNDTICIAEERSDGEG